MLQYLIVTKAIDLCATDCSVSGHPPLSLGLLSMVVEPGFSRCCTAFLQLQWHCDDRMFGCNLSAPVEHESVSNREPRGQLPTCGCLDDWFHACCATPRRESCARLTSTFHQRNCSRWSSAAMPSSRWRAFLPQSLIQPLPWRRAPESGTDAVWDKTYEYTNETCALWKPCRVTASRVWRGKNSR